MNIIPAELSLLQALGCYHNIEKLYLRSVFFVKGFFIRTLRSQSSPWCMITHEISHELYKDPVIDLTLKLCVSIEIRIYVK